MVKSKIPAAKQAGNLLGALRVLVAPEFEGAQVNDPAAAASRVTAAYKVKLKEILKPEQLAEYERQLKERDAFRRRANAECVAAVLEDRLSLNDAQRKELVDSLSDWSGHPKNASDFLFAKPSLYSQPPSFGTQSPNANPKENSGWNAESRFQFEMFNDGQEAVFIVE